MTEQIETAVTRTPYCHKIRYGVTGAPDTTGMEGSYAPGVAVSPTLVELIYSAARDSKPASVSASVTGWFVKDGKHVDPESTVTVHFTDGPDGWPEWLATEARLHDPEAAPLVVARFDVAMEHAPEEPPGLTVGAIAEDGRPVALVFDPESWAKVAGWLVPEAAHLRARIAELKTELARAQQPSYSQRHVWSVWQEEQPAHAFYGTVDDARQGSVDCWEEDEPVCPDYSWKPDGTRLELLVGGEASGVYISRHDVFGKLAEPEPGPALPWAHAMSDYDLGLFLDDLVSAAMGRWRSEPEIPDRMVLADIEKACAQWRTPGQGLRSDEPTAEAGEEQ